MFKVECDCLLEQLFIPPACSFTSPFPSQLVAVNDNVLIHPSSLVIGEVNKATNWVS